MNKLTRRTGAGVAASAAISAEMDGCIADIERLAADEEIPCEERALRLEQLAVSARGEYLPEVAFDPLAWRLRALAERLAAAPGPSPARAWQARVRRATTAAMGEETLAWSA